MVSEKGDRFFFHCVSIPTVTDDHSGQSVTAQRGVGHLGHDEAFEIEKETDASPTRRRWSAKNSD